MNREKNPTPWVHARQGWRAVCSMRARAEAGRLPPAVAPLWAVDWRRCRVAALVAAGFTCADCGTLIDPDKPFGVRRRDRCKELRIAAAADLVPVCGDCRRNTAEQNGTHPAEVDK